MAISSHFNKTVNTQRLGNVSGSKRQSWQALLSSISVAIHPINTDLVTVQNSAFYNTFKMFCSTTLNIEIGDRIIDGSDVYTVSGKALYDDGGVSTNKHMKCTLVKGK